MSNLPRRQFLKGVLGAMAQIAGTVVVATAATATASATEPVPATDEAGSEDIAARADRLAGTTEAPAETELNRFVNGGWRNAAFGNGGGFRNAAFRNGGFANGGGFRNAAFRNW